MTDDDKVAFVSALAELAATKPGANLTKEAYTAWWNAMRADWSIEDFKAACVRLRDTLEFFPNPFHFADLRRKASSEAADEAWAAVLANVRSGEYRRGITVGGKTDRIVRAMGGYPSLAMRDSQSLHTFGEKRFRELWGEIAEQEEARAALPNLAPANRLTGPQRAQLAAALKAIGPLKPRTDTPARYEP